MLHAIINKIDGVVRAAIVAAFRPLAALQTRLPQGVYIVLLAVVVGVMTGTLAFVLKWLIGKVAAILTSGLHPGGSNWALFVLPALGLLLAAMFQRYVLKHRIEHGTEQIKSDIARKDYWLKPDLLYAPITASTLTLGFGGSAGSEGPIAYTGAAIGSNVAKACGFSGPMSMALLATGAGAGIAGIFKSPVGGAMFSLEVLNVQMATASVMMLFVACIVSALTAYLWSGCTPDVHFVPAESFDSSILPAILVLGLFCGLYGSYYAYTAFRTRLLLDGIGRPWVRNLLAAASLGALVFVFPVLYGEGYGLVEKLVNGNHPAVMSFSLFAGDSSRVLFLILVGGVLLVKGIAATLTNSGGGVAGDFAPTFFAGAVAGFFFGTIANMIPGLALDTGVFALAGMAGTMAAVIKAPLMAIFLTAEMTWNYEFFLPITLSAITAYFVAMMFTKRVK